jgi:4-hydroxymandelate oxidase
MMRGLPVPPARDLDLAAMEQHARVALGDMAYSYYSGGAEDERLLDHAISDWDRHRLAPRVLRDVSLIDTSTSVLGHTIDHPILVAPTALHGLAHPDGEVATARGAAAAGAGFILSSLSTTDLNTVAHVRGEAPQWMQLYVLKDRGATRDLVARIAAAGYGALVLTVDAPVSGLRTRELRGGVALPSDLDLPNLAAAVGDRSSGEGFMAMATKAFDARLTMEDLEWLVDLAGIPVLVKGVVRADDAVACLDAGAAGVVVSNHGARQLDGAITTARALAAVADAVGNRAEVYVDGGIRRPADVVRALALGARAVLLGRPVLYALATGGEGGVSSLIDWMAGELRRTMALCGVASIDEIDRSLLWGES